MAKKARRDQPAADALEAEFVALTNEHTTLEAEHARLKNNRADVAGHFALAKRLRDHVERLHRYMEARGFVAPKRG